MLNLERPMQMVVNDEVIVFPSPMSEDEFFEFCGLNQDRRIERTAKGDIVVMPPTGGETGEQDAGLIEQLKAWTRRDGRGRAFSSSTGFTLPNGAVRSPDAGWILRSRWEGISRQERRRFAHITPDFVIELLSPSDRLSEVQEKMSEWIAQGARLGWLIDPDNRRVFIYRPNPPVEVLQNPAHVVGEDPVDGFVLDLKEIWEPA
jgi:Uma2 family endonuclease